MEAFQDLVDSLYALDRVVEVVLEVFSGEVHCVERVGLHHLVHGRIRHGSREILRKEGDVTSPADFRGPS